MNTNKVISLAIATAAYFGMGNAHAISFAQASISNVTFSGFSLVVHPSPYSLEIDNSYPFTTPTTLGATVYDLNYGAPHGYDSTYLNSYSFFSNLTTTASSNFNTASATSGSNFLTSEALSKNQIRATAIAATGSFVSEGSSGFKISPHSAMIISFDASATARDDGLRISDQTPFESSYAYAKLGFYGATGHNWFASNDQWISAATNADATPDDVFQQGHYFSWIINMDDAPLFVGLDARVFSESYGGGVVPVPEPETYAMMLVGLGLMGAVARRKKSKQA